MGRNKQNQNEPDKFPWKYLALHGLLTLAALPLVLEWIPPNPWFGFRLPGAAMAPNWYTINALGGKLFMVSMAICAAINVVLWLNKSTEEVLPYLGWINAVLIGMSLWAVTLLIVDKI